MDQKRPIIFMIASTAILMLWMTFVAPKFMPPPKPPEKPVVTKGDINGDGPAIAEIPGQPLPELTAKEPGEKEPAEKPEAKPAAAPPKFPHDEKITLGSLDPDSGYFAEAELTTLGAAVNAVRLNDPRYRELANPKEPLRLLNELRIPDGGDLLRPDGPNRYRSLQTAVDAFDKPLAAFHTSLDNLDWEVDPDTRTESSVTFRMPSLDGALEVRKRYTLKKPDRPADVTSKDFRDTNADGYELELEITIANRGDAPRKVEYTLQGPVGVPLENAENTRKYRDIRTGFLQPGGAVKSSTKTAAELVKEDDKGKMPQWNTPVRYIGVDTQFFAALLSPAGDPSEQLKDSWVEVSRPQILRKDKVQESHSDLSVRLTSKPLEIAAGDSVSHKWVLFTGPKREPLLEPLGADPIVDFGWASKVSRLMLVILNFFHNVLHLPYGLAIIGLTVVVRACLFPLSRKQAIGAKKMKDLQPKIAELKKKFGDDKEKFGRAQLELFGKYGYNPLAGCFPVLFQLPIFIGLYSALNTSVDLRMAPFLYIKNLAAPDALFQLPFVLPFLGVNDFNLLPIITVALFIIQQKLFTPPPMDEQQAATMKMMPWLMGFMGFMFYTVPAGLCIYFIASSLWGLAERKYLDAHLKNLPSLIDDTKKDDAAKPRSNLWTKLLAQADAAGQQAQGGQPKPASKENGDDDSGDGPRKDKRKSKNRR